MLIENDTFAISCLKISHTICVSVWGERGGDTIHIIHYSE